MILYHCTRVTKEVIEASGGIIPGEDSWRDWVDLLGPATPKENVVWLTTFPAFVGKPANVACMVRIPSTDRKLTPFGKVLRKAGLLKNVVAVNRGMGRCWHVYSGTIPLERISAIGAIEYQFTGDFAEEDKQDWLDHYGT